MPMKKLTVDEAIKYYEEIKPTLKLNMEIAKTGYEEKLKEIKENYTQYREFVENYHKLPQKNQDKKLYKERYESDLANAKRFNKLSPPIMKKYHKLVSPYNFILLTERGEKLVSFEFPDELLLYSTAGPKKLELEIDLHTSKYDNRNHFYISSHHSLKDKTQVNLIYIQPNYLFPEKKAHPPQLQTSLTIASNWNPSMTLEDLFKKLDSFEALNLKSFVVCFEYQDHSFYGRREQDGEFSLSLDAYDKDFSLDIDRHLVFKLKNRKSVLATENRKAKKPVNDIWEEKKLPVEEGLLWLTNKELTLNKPAVSLVD